MTGLIQDGRYALRSIRRALGVSIFAALIIGLGVGANTAVFSIMSPLMLRPLPFEEPERLVWIALNSEGGLSAVTSRTSNLRDYREMSQSFEELTGYFAFFEYQSYNLVGDGPPERLVGVPVAQDFLDVLGVVPQLGRNFVDEEGVWGGRPAAILTYNFWQRRFAGDPAVVGRSISLNGEPTEVVGVLPSSFDFTSTFAPTSRVDFLNVFPISDETDRWGNTLSIIGRLKPGVTVAQAQAELVTITDRLKEADPERWGLGAVVSGLQDQIAGDSRPAMLVLIAAAAFVMLIACANLSNLLLARGSRRRKEMAVRSAFGADRGRLMRQLTLESVLVATAGGIVGAFIAFGVTRVVAGTSAVKIPMLSAASVDGLALVFNFVVALLAGLLMGILPALRLSKGSEAVVIRDASRGTSEGPGGTFLRQGLVVAEIALACVLLVGGGLLLRSFVSLLEVDLGFKPENAFAWRVDTQRPFETNAERAAFYDQMVERVRAIPGVESVGLTDTMPLGRNRSWGLRAKGIEYGEDEWLGAFPRIVDHRYLETMRIPLLMGRHFTAADDGDSANAVIINETAAQRLYPGLDPIGKTALISGDEWQVVGVVANVRHQSLEEAPSNEMYLPLTQMGDYSAIDMVVRTSLPLGALRGSIGSVLHEVDPEMPGDEVQSLGSIVDRAISPRRFILSLLGAFAGAALLLAALGIYAVLSFSVSQRTTEIGIRMALGESSAGVLRRVVGQTLKLAGWGVALGVGIALMVSRLIQSMLYGVGPTDVSTFAQVAAILLLVSLLAGYLPARRASRTDPVEALRSA